MASSIRQLDVGPAGRGRLPGAGGHVGRHVHDHLVVPEHDRDLRHDRRGLRLLPVGGDQQDLQPAQGLDLARHRRR
jgi:hypothetical protein